MDIVSTQITYTISISFYNEKKIYEMDCYILHEVLLLIILLSIIAIICYHYTKHKSKQKKLMH